MAIVWLMAYLAGMSKPELYRERRKAGLCGTCGARSTSLRARCDRCHEAVKAASQRSRTNPAHRARHAAYMRKYYRLNKAKWADCGFQRKYGLSQAEYDALLGRQDGKCAVCGIAGDDQKRKRALCVDHCHTTGRIRGLLCDTCNRVLGLVADDATRLAKMAQYLKQ